MLLEGQKLKTEESKNYLNIENSKQFDINDFEIIKVLG